MKRRYCPGLPALCSLYSKSIEFVIVHNKEKYKKWENCRLLFLNRQIDEDFSLVSVKTDKKKVQKS